jgi:hypothetical protein
MTWLTKLNLNNARTINHGNKAKKASYVGDISINDIQKPTNTAKAPSIKATDLPIKYQKGGLFYADKKAFVDSTLAANKDKEFVQRLFKPRGSIKVRDQSGRSTHLMGSSDNIIFPSVVNKSGKLQYISDWRESADYAIKNKEYIKFKNDEQAEWFANSPDSTTGYKMGTGIVLKLQVGGRLRDKKPSSSYRIDTDKEDRDWLENWYTNRVVPNKQVNELYQKEKQDYIRASKSIPKPNYTGLIDNNIDIQGIYHSNSSPWNSSITLLSPTERDVYSHEADHHIYGHAVSKKMNNMNKNIFDYNSGEPRSDMEPSTREYYDYFTQPDEIHARVQVLRKTAGFRPDQVITPEDIDKFKSTYKGGKANIDDLFNVTDTEQLTEILNSMVSTDTGKKSRLIERQRNV